MYFEIGLRSYYNNAEIAKHGFQKVYDRFINLKRSTEDEKDRLRSQYDTKDCFAAVKIGLRSL